MNHQDWTRRFKRLFFVAAFAAVSALALAACGSDEGGSDGDSGDGGTLKVGFTPGLTGEVGPFDSEVAKGVRLKVDEINKAGGIDGKWKIDLVVRDSASDTAKARVATQDLLDEGIDFLIGSCSAAVSTPSAILAAQQSVPTVLTCAGESTFPEKVGGGFGFLSNSGSLVMGAGMAQFAVEENNWNRAFALSSNFNEYTEELGNGFAGAFEGLGGEIVGEENVTIGSQSFAATVNKVAAASQDFDVIMTPLFVPDVAALISELRSAGVDQPILLGDGADSPLLFAAGDPGDAFVFSIGAAQPGSPFSKAFQAKFGSLPQSTNPSLGADIVDLIADATAEAQSIDSTKLREAYANLEDVEVTTATVTYKGEPYGPGLLKRPLAVTTPDKSGEAFELVTRLEVDPAIVPEP